MRVFRRNRDTADSAHRLPQATVRRAGRAEDTSVCSASPWRYGLKPVVFFSFVLLLAVNVSTGHDELLKEIGAEALPLAYAFCAIIMLYLVGIADDLIGVRYRAKFFIQIVCGIMLVAGGVELSDLHGMLFIHSMPSWISIPLTVFVTVFTSMPSTSSTASTDWPLGCAALPSCSTG